MTKNLITFDAAEVSVSQCEECFQILLDSRNQSGKLITSLDKYDWNAPYLLLQRVFPEDDDESGCLSVGTHRPELSAYVSRLEVTLTNDIFFARWDRGSATVRLMPLDRDLQKFLRILRIIVPGAQITGHLLLRSSG